MGLDGMKGFWEAIAVMLGCLLLLSGCILPRSKVDPPTDGEFNVHFLDVTAGDAIIIDMGEREIIIDGGLHPSVLSWFVRTTEIIEEPVELVILTHSDIDHWGGLKRLLIEDRVEFLEFWEPGYGATDGEDKGFDEFLSSIERKLGPGRFVHPFGGGGYPLSSLNGGIRSFYVPSLPGVKFTALHSSDEPRGHNAAYRRNNASIVLTMEISGIKMLFTGDVTGKCKPEDFACKRYAKDLGHRIGKPTGKAPEEKTCQDYAIECGDPLYVEKELLALNAMYSGILDADILKVPHHGSETSSHPRFIQAVDPRYAVVCSTFPFHPKRKVIRRYKACSDAEILVTGARNPMDSKHISCTGGNGSLRCDYTENF
jgi:beta-lactamase superfamily II metal-dependent hydrolase